MNFNFSWIFVGVLIFICACSNVPQKSIQRNLSSTSAEDFSWKFIDRIETKSKNLSINKYIRNVNGAIFYKYQLFIDKIEQSKEYDEYIVTDQGIFLRKFADVVFWSKESGHSTIDYINFHGEKLISIPLKEYMNFKEITPIVSNFNEMEIASVSFISKKNETAHITLFNKNNKIVDIFPYAKISSLIPEIAIIGKPTGKILSTWYKLPISETIFGVLDLKSNKVLLEPRFSNIEILNESDIKLIKDQNSAKPEEGIVRVNKNPTELDVIIPLATTNSLEILNMGKCYAITTNRDFKDGIADPYGKTLIPHIYDFGPFSQMNMHQNMEKIKKYFPLVDGIIPFENNFKWGLILANNRTCQVVIEPIYKKLNLWQCEDGNILVGTRYSTYNESKEVETKLIHSKKGKNLSDATFEDKRHCKNIMEFPDFSFKE